MPCNIQHARAKKKKLCLAMILMVWRKYTRNRNNRRFIQEMLDDDGTVIDYDDRRERQFKKHASYTWAEFKNEYRVTKTVFKTIVSEISDDLAHARSIYSPSMQVATHSDNMYA